VAIDENSLPSWNETETKQAIMRFVAEVTQANGPSYVPPQERVAVFDNDGTLWLEKPMPIQVGFILRRLATMAEQNSALRQLQPWKAAYDKDYSWLGAAIVKHYHGDDGDLKVLLVGVQEAFGGMSVEEYEGEASQFLHTGQHPTLGGSYLN